MCSSSWVTSLGGQTDRQTYRQGQLQYPWEGEGNNDTMQSYLDLTGQHVSRSFPSREQCTVPFTSWKSIYSVGISGYETRLLPLLAPAVSPLHVPCEHLLWNKSQKFLHGHFWMFTAAKDLSLVTFSPNRIGYGVLLSDRVAFSNTDDIMMRSAMLSEL